MKQVRQGVSETEIARNRGLSRQTVHLWISARSFPERRPSSHSNTVDQLESVHLAFYLTVAPGKREGSKDRFLVACQVRGEAGQQRCLC